MSAVEKDEASTLLLELEKYRTEARVLRKIIATIPYYVFWKDIDSVYLGCNEILAGIAGLERPEDIVGRDDFMMPWKKEEAEYFRFVDRRVMDSGQAELNIEEPQLQADGKQRVLLTSKVPLRDESENVIGILGIFADITERKELEEQLRQAKDAAEASARAKSDFLAVMSHELRTPLTLIQSPLQTLLSDHRAELSPTVVSMLESVHRNARRLRVLTEDILEFSRHEAGRLPLENQALDIATHVRELVGDLGTVAQNRELELRIDDLDPNLGIVLVDAAKFDKILINLLGNALKFTKKGGSIGVSVRLIDQRIVLSVRDTGIGIDPNEIERLFQRFEQVDTGSTRRHGGMGLGLSVVKSFVEQMGGHVEVESALGQGATFSVSLPYIPAEDLASRLSGSDIVDVTQRAFLVDHVESNATVRFAPAGKQRRARLVVAEDNTDLRNYLTDLLSPEFDVVAVGDGRAAFEAVLSCRPDVVLSDVMMPGLDGFELIRKMKEDPELGTIPIVLLTARAGSEAMADSLGRGADDYLSKPFSPLDLVARLRVAYRTKALHEDLLEAERNAAALKEKEALQATQEALLELSKTAALGEMAAAVAHEINQPLASIGLNASTCLRWMRDEQLNIAEARLAAERVSRDARRVGEVVQRIRALFTPQAGPGSPLDLNDAVREVVALMKPRFGDACTSLRTDLAEELPRIRGDRVQLQQVVVNLLTNAMEAMKPGDDIPTEVTVRTRFVDNQARVEVCDTGPGVPHEQHKSIFRAFHTTKAQGMGMGLSICRTIVERHGGTLQVRNNADRGSTFSFAVPLDVPFEQHP